MAACEPQIFQDVSAEKWACLRNAIAAEGYAVTGDTGEASGQGVTLRWAYDAAAQTLTIQCMKHPVFIPCAIVNSRIRSMYEQSGC